MNTTSTHIDQQIAALDEHIAEVQADLSLILADPETKNSDLARATVVLHRRLISERERASRVLASPRTAHTEAAQ